MNGKIVDASESKGQDFINGAQIGAVTRAGALVGSFVVAKRLRFDPRGHSHTPKPGECYNERPDPKFITIGF